jgi:hypothetical protein
MAFSPFPGHVLPHLYMLCLVVMCVSLVSYPMGGVGCGWEMEWYESLKFIAVIRAAYISLV